MIILLKLKKVRKKIQGSSLWQGSSLCWTLPYDGNGGGPYSTIREMAMVLMELVGVGNNGLSFEAKWQWCH
jgi:hypothetical protein